MESRSDRQRRAGRTHAVNVGVLIPADADDLRLQLKREIFTRGLVFADVANRTGLSASRIKHCMSNTGKWATTIHPGFLDRIIEAIHITPRVARRLHLLAAREAGWKV